MESFYCSFFHFFFMFLSSSLSKIPDDEMTEAFIVFAETASLNAKELFNYCLSNDCKLATVLVVARAVSVNQSSSDSACLVLYQSHSFT